MNYMIKIKDQHYLCQSLITNRYGVSKPGEMFLSNNKLFAIVFENEQVANDFKQWLSYKFNINQLDIVKE